MLTTGKHAVYLEGKIRGLARGVLKPAVKTYRHATRSLRTTPDFIIAGARKCGTTSLYHYLALHPQVLPALKKEIFYFDQHYEEGTAWYRAHFPTRLETTLRQFVTGKPVMTGEATASYFFHPDVPDRILETRPNARLLFILRDPVDAVYSAYQFGIKVGTYTEEEVPFESVVDEALGAVGRGEPLFALRNGRREINPACTALARYVYVDLLEPWIERFPREQLKILVLEEFYSDPKRAFAEVVAFLGLDPYCPREYPTHNGNSYAALPHELRLRLTEFFEPHNNRLSDFLGRTFPWPAESASCSERLDRARGTGLGASVGSGDR